MGLNFNTREWQFLSDGCDLVSVSGIYGIDSLTYVQRRRLEEGINQAFSKMGDKLGCTHLVEHVIHTELLPQNNGITLSHRPCKRWLTKSWRACWIRIIQILRGQFIQHPRCLSTAICKHHFGHAMFGISRHWISSRPNGSSIWQRSIEHLQLSSNRRLFQFKRLTDIALKADLFICTSTFEKHVVDLMKRLQEAGLTLNRCKCVFCCF